MARMHYLHQDAKTGKKSKKSFETLFGYIWKDQNPGWKKLTPEEQRKGKRASFIELLSHTQLTSDKSKMLRDRDPVAVSITTTI